jgi:streptogramin lyase
MKSRYLVAFACTLAALLSACGGSSSGGVAPVPVPSSSGTPVVTPTTSPVQQASNINFKLFIPAVASASSAAVRTGGIRTAGVRTEDFSAVTQSVTIAIGTQVLKTADVSTTSSLCTAATGGRNCTIGVTAPNGTDTFTVTAYDQQNGTGNAIAEGTMVETVSSTATSVNVAVTGTIAKIAVALSNPYPTVGQPATSTVAVTGTDIDGNVVLGPYASPITLSDSDTTGATSLSATTLAGSSNTATLSYNGAMGEASATITASLAGVASASAAFAVEPAYLTYYEAPQASGRYPGVWHIAKGSDGNMWVACTGVPEVIKVTSNGATTVYPLPGNGPGAQGIVLGSDGNLWVANQADSAIVQVTTSGVTTAFPIQQTGQTFAIPNAVGLGPDGNVWFNDGWNHLYGKITPGGTITEFASYATTAAVSAITAGPDGNLWMLDASESKVWKVSTSGGVLATYTLPTTKASPSAIAVGPDGNLWIAEQSADKIARMTTSGTVTEFNIPTPSGNPDSIVAGPDGRMWFAEQGPPPGPGKIGYITVDGSQIRDFLGGTGYHVHDLAFDSNKILWYLGLAGYNPSQDQVIGTFEY